MSWSHLSPEQAEEARQIYEKMRQNQDDILKEIAGLLASKPDHQLLGQTEFEVRDRVHQMGAEAIETAARAAEKRGYRASSVSCPKCQECRSVRRIPDQDARQLARVDSSAEGLLSLQNLPQGLLSVG